VYICFRSDPDHTTFLRDSKSNVIRKTYINPIIFHAIIIVKYSPPIERRASGGRIVNSE